MWVIKMEKKCNLCGSIFKCYGDTSNCWCKDILINEKNLKEISSFGDDCFCENCLRLLSDNKSMKFNQMKTIVTNKQEFKITIKKTPENKFLIQISDQAYDYPLLLEEFDNDIDALKEFYQYSLKLEKNEFKIIRNFEALDEHYRRIFTKVKFGILFT